MPIGHYGEMPMNIKVVGLSAAVVTAFAVPAVAHHSFAMFDAQKTLTIEGTVKELEWVNPHAWLRIMVDDQKLNRPVLWAFEMSSPGRLVTMGMRADSVKPGDKVSVTFHPMRDGSRGGQFMQAMLPNGQAIVRANARDENEEN
jgi:Family of unknown function (DUF6152)